MSREPPGCYFGERVLLPECSSRCLWSDVFSTWTPSRSCTNGVMLDFHFEENTMYCTKLLLERAITARSKMEKPSDEPPTEQEHMPGDRADQRTVSS